MNKKNLQRILISIFGLAFIGSTGIAAIAGLFSKPQTPQANDTGNSPSVEEQIAIRVSGYEKVLAREPDNPTALEGLAQIYVQTGNMDKAIPPLEKLVKLYPERQELAQLLEGIKYQQILETEEQGSGEVEGVEKTEE